VVETNVEPLLRVQVTPTPVDLRRLARVATRRLRRIFLVVGLLLCGSAALAFADGDPSPFLAGMIVGILGVSLVISAGVLPWQVARRLPEIAREPRTYAIDAAGLQVSAATWANWYSWATFRKATLTRHLVLLAREWGTPGVVLPRSGFTPEEEGRLLAVLTDRGLLADRGLPTPRST
jgi:hypothetical protein